MALGLTRRKFFFFLFWALHFIILGLMISRKYYAQFSNGHVLTCISYWDLDYEDHSYSYVNTALDAGYSTLAIDRLGVGNSTHGDPLNE